MECAAQERGPLGWTVDRDNAEEERKAEWNAAGEEFEDRRGDTEQRDGTCKNRLRRVRQPAAIRIEQEDREHEIRQTEREIDSKQPEAVEQQQRRGNRRKAALAPFASPPAPQR